jgi:aspartyl-tRNA(Asn)/glutamyl-tRNA(Gln) amidotransferase subunit A
MARTVSDLAALLEVLAGYDPGDPFSIDAPARDYREALAEDIDGLRIGVPRNFFFEDVDEDIVLLVEAAGDVLASAGANLVEVDLRGADDAVEAMTTMIRAEALAIHRQRLAEDPDAFGGDVRRRLLLGEAVSGADYGEARQRARVWCRRVEGALEQCDVLLTPSTGTTAPPADSEMIETTRRLVRLTYGWSLAGLPALSVPCGLSDAGLPVGLQLAAAPLGEATVLRVGAAYQNLTDWHLREPGVTGAKGER